MRIAHLDCHSGASGDMMLAALVDAGVDLEQITAGIESLGLPGLSLVSREVQRQGFRALKIDVEHPREHAHRHLNDIAAIIASSGLSQSQRELAVAIFRRLAEAEATVHGTTPQKVHFHEVGALDSIADIIGAAIGWDLLAAERVTASAVPTGNGTIRIAHGRVSVPAPATAELLKGIPLAESAVDAELTTPTGAAILATIVHRFGPRPAMTIHHIGCGAGSREFEEQPNVLRLLVGEAAAADAADEETWLLETNLDDSTGELIGHCVSKLWEGGALDVFMTPIQMKKNRPAVQVSVLCQKAEVPKIEAILIRETTTLGVRRYRVERTTVERHSHHVTTRFGDVEGKIAYLPGGGVRFSPEYESCRRLAEAQGVPLPDVYEAANRGFAPDDVEPKQCGGSG